MARTRLNFPTTKLDSIFLRVRITDINYGNHLGNDALVGLLHEARVAWLQKLGYTEFNIEDKSIIMSELIVNYLGESFYGDELIVNIASGDISSAGFELYYEINTSRDGSVLTVAVAKTGLVFFDYITRKVTQIPEKFRSLLCGN